jgi:hypothetical protein
VFAVFSKLTGDEEMPRLEELRPRSLPFPGWRKRPAAALRFVDGDHAGCRRV